MSSTEVTSTEGQSVRLCGQVKWFNNKAGYGFITVNDGDHSGKDIFIHYSTILTTNTQYKYLVQGEYVEFNLVKSNTDDHEYQATDVSGIKNGPLMCESRRTNRPFNGPPPQQYENRPYYRNDSRPPRVGDDNYQVVRRRRAPNNRKDGPPRKDHVVTSSD